MRRKDADKGVSIVELVVVIAIMTIVAAGGLSLVGMIPRRQVLGASNKLVYYLDKTRTNAMSFQKAELWIHMEDDGLYATMVTNQTSKDAGGAALDSTSTYTEERIGNADLEISYFVTGAGADTDLGTNTLVICYDRASGAFTASYIIPDGATQATAITEGDDNHTVSKIYVEKGRFKRIINLIRLTGKVTSEWE